MAKILVIDNTKAVRRAIVARLREAGYEATEAEDGTDGIELLKQNMYDAVILEMLLTTLDGTAVLAFLETQPICPAIIAMTGGHEEIPAELAILPAKPVAAATLLKPIDEGKLLAAVERALSGKTAAA
jgi:CheY-like chemotaxis protein